MKSNNFLYDKKGVIIFVDGGICSQIYSFAIGLKFSKMGYKVKYDLSFFESTDSNNGGGGES